MFIVCLSAVVLLHPTLQANDDQAGPAPAAPATPIPSTNSKEGRFHAKITIAGIPLLGLMHEIQTVLIPRNAEFSKKLSMPDELDSSFMIFGPKDRVGSFYATADAEGDVFFNHVPPGTYKFIIFTREIIQLPAQAQRAKHILSKYFTDESAELLSHYRTDSADIEVLPGEEVKRAYHFD